MAFSLFLRALRKANGAVLNLRRKLWMLRAKLQSTLAGGELRINENILLDAPFRCDGRGKVELANEVKLGYRKAPRVGNGEILLQARGSKASIYVGAKSAFSNNVSMIANNSITIGENCLIGDMVSVFDSDFHGIEPAERHTSRGEVIPVVIGNNVMLGSQVTVLKGATIGDNSIIAAGSVVTKSIPRNVIAGGVPASFIRSLD